MANQIVFLYVNGSPAGAQSNQLAIDFLSVKVGASGLEIKETTGNFDFSAKKLTNIAAGTAAGDAVEYDQLNTALGLKINSSEKGAANGVATLGADSKIPESQIPAVALIDVFEVATLAARDALVVGPGVGEVQKGDVVIVADASPDVEGAASYVRGTSSYIRLRTPTDAVLSVNGQTGVVSLNSSHLTYTQGNVAHWTVADNSSIKDTLDEVGSRLTTNETNITTLQGQVANLSQPTKTLQNAELTQFNIREVGIINDAGNIARASRQNAGNNRSLVLALQNIAGSGSGSFLVKPGEIVTGFTGQNIGARYLADNGQLTEIPPTFVLNDNVWVVGRFISPTEFLFNPDFVTKFVNA